MADDLINATEHHLVGLREALLDWMDIPQQRLITDMSLKVNGYGLPCLVVHYYIDEDRAKSLGVVFDKYGLRAGALQSTTLPVPTEWPNRANKTRVFGC